MSDDYKLPGHRPADLFSEATEAQIVLLKQEVESLRAENAALKRMKAKAPRRRSWRGFVLKYLVLAAFIGVAVFSLMNKNRTLENTFDQISRALQ